MKNEAKIRKLLKENEWDEHNFCFVCERHNTEGHIKGCWMPKALALLAEPEKPHGWIPVSERLPKDNDVVDAIAKVKKASSEYNIRICDVRWEHTKVCYPASYTFTHWKPIILPEPEKGGE